MIIVTRSLSTRNSYQALLIVSIFLCWCFPNLSTANEDTTIDGLLNEPYWDQADQLTKFYVVDPLTLKPSSVTTTAKIFATSQGLTVAIINTQPENTRNNVTHARDGDSPADFIELLVDFDATGLSAYSFRVTSGGAIQDAVWNDENRKNTDWDGDWKYAVSHDEDSWTAELLIPWGIAPMQSMQLDEREIKYCIRRNIYFQNQLVSSPAINPSQTTFISKFSSFSIELSETVDSDSVLNIFPYVSLSHDLARNESNENVGVDLFWKPSSNQQINLTINPDFGQVESDELTVNFSAIENFFSEKRPFFVENHALFDLQGPENLRLVHTPRIGSEPDAGPAQASEISAAARFTHIGTSFDAAALVASEKDAGSISGRDYLAARLRYRAEDFDLGYLLTTVKHNEIDRNSLTHVIDYHFNANDAMSLNGQLINTNIDEDNTKNDSTSYWTQIEYQATEQWSHALTAINYARDMNVTDFGFVKRVNREQIEYETEYEINEFSENSPFREIGISFGLEKKDNHDKDGLADQIEAAIEVTLFNTMQVEFQAEHQTSGSDDLITRGNGSVLLPSYNRYELAFVSDERKPFTYGASISFGQDNFGDDYREYSLEYEHQLTPYFQISTEVEYVVSDSWLNWLEDSELATYKRKEFSLGFNVESVISDRHELRIKVEGVALRAGEAQGYSLISNNTELVANNDNLDDFELSEFAAQIRYRYRIGALTDLFITYSRGGEYEEDLLFRDVTNLIEKSIGTKDDENLSIKLRLQY